MGPIRTAAVRADEILSRLGANPVGAELGVFHGSLSSCLLVRPDLRLIMVDSWGDTYQPGYDDGTDFVGQLSAEEMERHAEAAEVLTRHAEDRRTIIRSDTALAVREMGDRRDLDFVFVDADHSYSGCRRDIEAWVPCLKPGGLLCGHDYAHPDYPTWDVKRAVDEFAAARGLTVELGEDYTWFVRMPGPLPEPATTGYDRIVFACVKWGDKYGPEYVNVLADMVARNCILPHRFVCFTDDPTGMVTGIETEPLPPGLDGWWNKVALFKSDLFPARSRIVFLDLDVIVCGPLEDLIATKGIAADWLQGGYNSSVMVWDAGEHREAWDHFKPDTAGRLHGDQDWLTELGGWELLPTDWVVSYRLHSVTFPPEGAKVVAFHGWPKPADVTTGWVPEMWSMGGLAIPRYTSQLNNDIKVIRANVMTNVARDIPFVDEVPAHGRTLIIAAGGPSLTRWLPTLQLERAKATYGGGCDLWVLNGVHDYLIDRGIVPDAMVMLDSRAACVEAFLSNPHPDVEYLIATQCDPAAFDRLAWYQATRWTGWYWGVEKMDTRFIGGGNTVGLHALSLAAVRGYRTIKLFGYDSSYEGDADHAYPQPMNANDLRVEVVLRGRKFTAARWMVKQVVCFLGVASTMTAEWGVNIQIHGDGLLRYAADIAGEKEKKVA
jgi:hypothetical protein